MRTDTDKARTARTGTDSAQLDLGLAGGGGKESEGRSQGTGDRKQEEAAKTPHPAPAPAPPVGIVTHWVRIPQADGTYLLKPGRPIVAGEEIGTREAAEILGVHQRTVEGYCDQGVLREGTDWRRDPAPRQGRYRIKREAVMRLRGM